MSAETVISAIETLARATTDADRHRALGAVRSRVLAERTQDRPAHTLGAVVLEAIAYRDELKRQGATPEDLDAGLEAILRDRWPAPRDRTTPWRYLCELCQDTGLRIFTCRPSARCNGISTRTDGPGSRAGKERRLCVMATDETHEYGEPCVCERGARFRPRARGVDDFVSAAKASKPTRFGR